LQRGGAVQHGHRADRWSVALDGSFHTKSSQVRGERQEAALQCQIAINRALAGLFEGLNDSLSWTRPHIDSDTSGESSTFPGPCPVAALQG
jgi:hypothetical protein